MEIIHVVVHFATTHGLSVPLIVAQWTLGVAIAIRDGEFDITRTSDVLRKSGPLVLGYAVCDLLLKQPALTTSIFGLIVSQLSADIASKLGVLYPVLNKFIPETFLKKVS